MRASHLTDKLDTVPGHPLEPATARCQLTASQALPSRLLTAQTQLTPTRAVSHPRRIAPATRQHPPMARFAADVLSMIVQYGLHSNPNSQPHPSDNCCASEPREWKQPKKQLPSRIPLKHCVLTTPDPLIPAPAQCMQYTRALHHRLLPIGGPDYTTPRQAIPNP